MPVLKEIQYLRAISVLMVLYSHAGAVLWHQYYPLSPYFDLIARTGVDIFFVISGYVVSSSLFRTLTLYKSEPLLARLEKNIGGLKAFFIKRVFRLFPIVVLLIYVDILFHGLYPHEVFPNGWISSFTEDIMGLFSHITMQSDLDLVRFTTDSHQFRTVNHFWSLAAEERFYVIVPFVIILCASYRRFMWFALAVILGLALLKALYAFPECAMYHNGFLRFDSFMFGIIVYLLHRHTNVMNLVFAKVHNRIAMNMLSILLLVIAGRLPVSEVTGSRSGDYLVFTTSAYYFICTYTIAAILIAMAAQGRGYVLAIPGFRRILFWLGDRSYIIYVFQFFYMLIAMTIASHSHIQDPYFVQITGIFLVVTVILSEIIHRFLGSAMAQ